MKAQGRFFARVLGATATTILVGVLGCEQVIGLDGPYIAAPPATVGECTNAAVETCYSGDPALEGIGACQSGMRTCTNGTWAACMGEGAPSIEQCTGNDDDCDGKASCDGNVTWALSFGGTGNDGSTSLATDADRNVVVVGSFDKPASFGGMTHVPVGGSDLLIFKLDADGKYLWSKAYGSDGSENARAVAIDSKGNILVVGSLAGPIDFGSGPLPQSNASLFVAKFDSSGAHQWSKSFVGAQSLAWVDLAIDANDNALISLTITGSMNFGAGLQTAQNESLAIVKLDPNGSLMFSRLFGSSKTSSTLRSAIAADPMGNIGIAGSFWGSITFGSTTLTAGQQDVFLAKLSPTGEGMWVVQGVGGATSFVKGLAIDQTGAFVVSGSFDAATLVFGPNEIPGYTDSDAYLAKFDTNGKWLWGKAFGLGGAVEHGAEVEVDDANNISFTGNTTSDVLDLGKGPVGPAGLFVMKLNPDGNTIWAKTTDTATVPYPDAAIAVDKQAYTLLTRTFVAPMGIGGIPLTGYGSNDVFVAKLGP